MFSRFISQMNGIKEPFVVNLKTLDIRKPAIQAANYLTKGGVIATPTDTIYGLAAIANNSEAVKRIYEIKGEFVHKTNYSIILFNLSSDVLGRNFSKPVAICVSEVQDLYHWSHVNIPEELLKELLPGPVTLCFNRKDSLSPELNPGADLVGIRIPDHEFIREVCRLTKLPLALTSANVSSAQSTLSIDEFKELHHKLDGIFDGGTLGFTDQTRLGSTIIDLSVCGKYSFIREGCAKNETIKKLEKYGLKHEPEN